MFLIYVHAKPNPTSEDFGKFKGAYVTFYIDYKDIDGAYELTRFYVQNNDWEVLEIENDYYIINGKDEIDKRYQEYYDEIIKTGYTSIYNTYEREE